jgi:phosphopantothenoylcysteine synthetase/decarboxylase
MKQVNILLGVTGSVAAIKTAKIVELLLALESPEIKIKVEIVQTEASRHFFKIEEYPELIQSGVKVWRDSNEWEVTDTNVYS